MSDPKPTAEEIYEWLMDTYGRKLAERIEDATPDDVTKKAKAWARYLEGLAWGYIKPVAQIAVNAHHDHPAIVLATAAAGSQDILFKLTARNHIAAKGEERSDG